MSWKKIQKKKWFRIFKLILIFFFGSTLLVTVIYKGVNPPLTPLMFIRSTQQLFSGNSITMDKKWVNIKKISPYMIRAVITSEDQNFLKHWGFDFNAIEKAYDHNQKENARSIKGASTISQQTAKNVFLWPYRDWIRKGLEIYFTPLIEIIWGKKRIIEIYLNIIEFGDGIYGVEAASQHYYHKPASALTKNEAVSLAAIIPAPLKWSPVKPSGKVLKRKEWILSHIYKTKNISF